MELGRTITPCKNSPVGTVRDIKIFFLDFSPFLTISVHFGQKKFSFIFPRFFSVRVLLGPLFFFKIQKKNFCVFLPFLTISDHFGPFWTKKIFIYFSEIFFSSGPPGPPLLFQNPKKKFLCFFAILDHF